MEYYGKKELLEGIEKELEKYCQENEYEQSLEEKFQMMIMPSDFKDQTIPQILENLNTCFYFYRDDPRPWHNPFTFYIKDQQRNRDIIIIYESKKIGGWEIKYPDWRIKK